MPAPIGTAPLTPHCRVLLDQAVQQVRSAGSAGAAVSVWCATTDGRTAYAADEDAAHYAASTMKLPLLVAAYRRHVRGEIDLDAPVAVRNEFASVADGSPFDLDRADDQDDETWARVGGRSTLRWLVRQAIVRSGNLATNLVLEHVGTAEVSSVLADAGCSATTVLPRGIEDAEARRAGLDNRVTARDLGVVMAGIGAGTLGPSDMCAEVEQVLAQQQHRDGIPAGLPPGAYVANKTGWVDGVTHDVGLVRPPSAAPYVLSVCTTVDVPEEAANALIAEISRLVWTGWTA